MPCPSRRTMAMQSLGGMACLSVAALAISFAGCERKEKVLDIETPSGEVEVERSLDTGRVDVEVNDQK